MSKEIITIETIEEILKEINFPQQHNTELTRIVVLALLNRTPQLGLIKGKICLHDGARITDIINKFANGMLGKEYKENSRESVRKTSIKSLQEFGLIEVNKDNPGRATNSGNTNYTITPSFENLIMNYSTPNFDKMKLSFFNEIEHSRKDYIDTLKSISIKITLPNGKVKIFSPGEHNIIQKFIVEDLIFLDSDDPHLVYIGDTGQKEKLIDFAAAELINLTIDVRSKVPDVVIYDEAAKKVLVYEAVANCGPVDGRRKKEIEELFTECPFPLEMYSVFLSPQTFQKYAPSIASGTCAFIIEKHVKIDYTSYTTRLDY